MFHVEHCPVEPTPTAGRALLDQLVGVRIQRLHRERQGQFRHRSGCGAIKPGDRAAALAALTTDLKAQGMDRARGRQRPIRHRLGCRMRLSDHARHALAVADQPFVEAITEGPAATQQEHGLEQRGLAGAIRAVDQVDARAELEPRGLDATQIEQIELCQGHVR